MADLHLLWNKRQDRDPDSLSDLRKFRIPDVLATELDPAQLRQAVPGAFRDVDQPEISRSSVRCYQLADTPA